MHVHGFVGLQDAPRRAVRVALHQAHRAAALDGRPAFGGDAIGQRRQPARRPLVVRGDRLRDPGGLGGGVPELQPPFPGVDPGEGAPEGADRRSAPGVARAADRGGDRGPATRPVRRLQRPARRRRADGVLPPRRQRHPLQLQLPVVHHQPRRQGRQGRARQPRARAGQGVPRHVVRRHPLVPDLPARPPVRFHPAPARPAGPDRPARAGYTARPGRRRRRRGPGIRAVLRYRLPAQAWTGSRSTASSWSSQ